MSRKQRIAERLEKLETLTGVLPTATRRSRDLDEAARDLRAGRLAAAEAASSDDLEATVSVAGSRTPASELYGDSELREQLAGFAEAGINLFYADREMMALPAKERANRGASGAVSRVLMADRRLLLETPRVVVRFEEGTDEAARARILAENDLVDIETPNLPPDTVRAAMINAETTAVSTALRLLDVSAIAYAEPDFVEHIGSRYTPTDPDFGAQWHHSNIGAELAWDASRGQNITIAVIDNGFDINHGDLAFGARSGWFNPTPDFLDADFVPGTQNMPDNDHGTSCAGMIAAREGSGQGGCGVAFGATLNMLACAKDQVSTQTTLARAIHYAANPSSEGGEADEGSDIIACSLGPNGATWTMRAVLSDAIDEAAAKGRNGRGCAIFWASTNGPFPISSDEVCSHPLVAAVGRSRRDDQNDGSGFGDKLEFLAPGVRVFVPGSGGGYKLVTGTSFAAPCAAGVAALALSLQPNLTATELRALLRETCDKVGPLPYSPSGHNIRFGHGRINAAAAVARALQGAGGGQACPT